jgi:GntR family transcriptional repressor for pyruvate dehydrogenase complex
MSSASRSTSSSLAARRTKTSVLVAHEVARQAAELEEGDSLPSEKLLLEQFGVGRGTLREALRLLELQGVLTIKAGPGGGPIVARPDHRPLAYSLALALQGTPATFYGLMKARSSIESVIARLAASERTDEQVTAMHESVEAMKAKTGNEEAFLQENLTFHALLAEAAGNRILQLFHATLSDLSDGHAFGVSYSPKHQQIVISSHAAIVDAIEGKDAGGAYEAMTEHMDTYERYISRRFPELLDRPIRWMLTT